jgi:hypothetical protein
VRTLALLVAIFTALPVVPAGAQPARRDLQADERCGGHTIARHVGKTNPQLAERLRQQAGISAASTYPDLQTAETVVGAALAREHRRVAAWSARRGPRPNLALRYRAPGPRPIGRSWQRGKVAPDGCFQAVVVLRWDTQRGDFCVLTSYPEVGR